MLMFDANFIYSAAKAFLSKKNIYLLLKEKGGKICVFFSDGKNTQTFEIEPNKWVSINDLFNFLENGSEGK